ncbi:hypothetical protein ONZ45_g17385 [Pleurotus djamor]|nr:hypothetical protein ONZ45_g17385 [Pleurotus djamor]
MSTPSFTVDKARLVGLFLECIAYGIFLITFPLCIRALLWTQGRMRSLASVNWLMLIAALLLAFFVTFDVIITLIWHIKAFVTYKGPGGPVTAFTDISNWMNVMRSVNLIIPILIGDLVLIYRCWVVYNQSYLAVLFPALVWAGDASMGSYVIYIENHLHEHGSLQTAALADPLTAFLVLTVAQNIITTALIILRIRHVDQLSAKYVATTSSLNSTLGKAPRRKTKLQRVMRIVIESGLLYTLTAIISLGTYLADTFAYNSVTDAELPIIVIAFNLIIIRAKSQPTEQTEYTFAYTHESAIQIKVPTTQSRSTMLRSGTSVVSVTEETDIEMSYPKSKAGGDHDHHSSHGVSDTYRLPPSGTESFLEFEGGGGKSFGVGEGNGRESPVIYSLDAVVNRGYNTDSGGLIGKPQ